MAVLPMKRITICGLKEHRKGILEELQQLGWLEIDLDDTDETFQRMDTDKAKAMFQKKVQLAEEALQALSDCVPEKSTMLAGLKGKQRLEGGLYGSVSPVREKYLQTAKRISDNAKEIAEARAQIQKLELQSRELEPWLPLDVPMDTSGTRDSVLLLGTLPEPLPKEAVLERLGERYEGPRFYELEILTRTRDSTFLAVLCLRECAGELEESLRQMGFARPARLTAKTPGEERKELERRTEQYRARIHTLHQEIRGMAGEREHLKLLADYYRVRADKYELLGTLPQTQNAFALSGYVPEKYAEKLARKMRERYGAVAEVEELFEADQAPVLLANGRFAGSGEGVLASFGLPGKGELDPTCIMTVFYVFLFGIMLSDAAYGLLVAAGCAAVLLKFPGMEENLRKSIQLFFWCGLSTLVWGILFGGFFGDAVDVVAKTFFHAELAEGESLLPALWFVPLNDPMKLLIYAMLFGCVHLFTGLFIKGWMNLKKKDYLAFLCDTVCWFLLILGLILMLLPTSMFASISQMEIVFPEAVNLLAKGMAAGGALGILFLSGRGKKNPGLRLALGAYDLYNVTGWLSDILSYSRLLALGLATGVIASVINQMGSMFGDGVLGAVGFAAVFLVGHTFNLGINLLGAYVHTCRLQYVEFFGKFYEGGGREFKPFSGKTKYFSFGKEK